MIIYSQQYTTGKHQRDNVAKYAQECFKGTRRNHLHTGDLISFITYTKDTSVTTYTIQIYYTANVCVYIVQRHTLLPIHLSRY
jgi:hypothetical protein